MPSIKNPVSIAFQDRQDFLHSRFPPPGYRNRNLNSSRKPATFTIEEILATHGPANRLLEMQAIIRAIGF